jgi:phospholipid transport system substrate-binding protein
MISRRTAWLALVAPLVLPVALVLAPSPARAATIDAVTAPVARFQQALLAEMQSPDSSFERRYDILAPAVHSTFDLDVILRNCVGPHWASFSAEQQAALAHVFDQFTTASWVANFARYGGEQFIIVPELRHVGADEIVQTRIDTADGTAHRIDYQMRETPDGWRAVDVLLDGSISRVAVQRSDFRSALAGNSPEPLIETLRQKVASLSGGALPS